MSKVKAIQHRDKDKIGFTEPYPARSAFAVKDLPSGAKIEIEVIASYQN